MEYQCELMTRPCKLKTGNIFSYTIKEIKKVKKKKEEKNGLIYIPFAFTDTNLG